MANEIGSAFVSIFAKLDKGFKKEIKKGVDDSANGVDESAGALIGGKIGKGITKALGKLAIGAFITDSLVKAFNGAAEFEQLAGGVEKIFDQMDRTQIWKDASEAYKTLNMSANDYLATINDVGANFASTMGDQKGYETAKKGLQAIADYASGTGKDLNLLQDKFTLITRATSSYQSIADQFAGVLPATSQAFLEQAQEAGFLADNYKKLTEVPIEEYQQAVADMLEKGVTDLGLYGNTLEETEKTLSGALNAMSASWENWLVNLSDGENTREATQQLIDSILIVLQNAEPVIFAIIEGIISNLPGIIFGLTEVILQLIVDLIYAIAGKLGEIAGYVGDAIGKAVSAVGGFVGQFISAGADLVRGIAQGIMNAPGAVINAIIDICKQGLQAVKSFFGIASPSKVMAQQGRWMMLGLAKGIGSESASVMREIDRVNNGIASKVTGTVAYTSNLSGGSDSATQAINSLHRDLYAIIKDATPDGLTSRQFSRLVNSSL